MKTMQREHPTGSSSSNKSLITCHAPAAQAVFIAGTFNEWQPTALALKRGDAGDWNTTLDLRPGRYEYKFIVDGAWCCEAGCEHAYRGCANCVPNAFGTMNRVLEVD